jgi:hypothetical protein
VLSLSIRMITFFFLSAIHIHHDSLDPYHAVQKANDDFIKIRAILLSNG